MKVLVTSGTGKVGSELIKRIFGRGHEPVVMTHSLDHLKGLPDGIEGILGDFERPESWREVLKGINKVCLITPLMKNEARWGSEFAKFACEQGIEQIVLLSIYKAEAGMHISHFNAKIEIEQTIKASKVPYTFIRANHFFQNDLYFIHELEEQGMYIQPLGAIGLNRVDVRDIADAMANALFDTRFHNQAFPLVGEETLSGKKTAEIYSSLIENRITYPENSLSIWEATMGNALPSWLLEDMKMMYEFFLMEGLKAERIDFIEMHKILGKHPRRFEDYAAEIVGKKKIRHKDSYGDWISRGSY